MTLSVTLSRDGPLQRVAAEAALPLEWQLAGVWLDELEQRQLAPRPRKGAGPLRAVEQRRAVNAHEAPVSPIGQTAGSTKVGSVGSATS